jgi:4-hydroxybenzoate polyprenyltransferase
MLPRTFTIGEQLRTLFRCASCRFVVFYYVPFFAGLIESNHLTAFTITFGFFFWLVQSLATEVTNRLADRVEDEVNRPERTALCAAFGWERLRALEWALWGTMAIMSGIWLAVDGNVGLALMLVGCILVGIGYSRGPRLSRSRAFAFLMINVVFGGSYFVGWMAGDPTGALAWQQLESFFPLLVVVGLFILVLAGIKDITDEAGDREVGYRSPFVEVVNGRASAIPWLLALAPSATTALFVLTGLLPLRLAVLLIFAPVSLALMTAAARAQTVSDRLIVREAFYNYWLIYSSTALLAFAPSWEMMAAITGSAALWLGATYFLHWGDGLGRADLRHLLRLSRASQRSVPASLAAGAGQ